MCFLRKKKKKSLQGTEVDQSVEGPCLDSTQVMISGPEISSKSDSTFSVLRPLSAHACTCKLARALSLSQIKK